MKIPTSEIANNEDEQIRQWWQDREKTTDTTKRSVLWQLVRNRIEHNVGVDYLNRRREHHAVTVDFCERLIRWLRQRQHAEVVLTRVLYCDGEGADFMYCTDEQEA